MLWAGKLTGWVEGRVWAQAALILVPCPEPSPGPDPSTALRGVLPWLHYYPYLGREHQLWHLPPRGIDAQGKGNSTAKKKADAWQPEAGHAPGSNPGAKEQCWGPEPQRWSSCLEPTHSGWEPSGGQRQPIQPLPPWPSGQPVSSPLPSSPPQALPSSCPTLLPPTPSSFHSLLAFFFYSFPGCLAAGGS